MSVALSPISNDLTAEESVPDLIDSFSIQESFGMDMAEFLNFDEFESGPSSAHSPSTMSPNHTPSPHITKHDLPSTTTTTYSAPSPHEFSFFSEMIQEKPLSAAPEVDDKFIVKAEPQEFVFTPSTPPAQPMTISEAQIEPPPPPPPPLQHQQQVLANNLAFPTGSDFSALPADQQAALQQLYDNLLQYTQTFVSNQQQTIEPSLLFSSGARQCQPQHEQQAQPQDQQHLVTVEAKPQQISSLPSLSSNSSNLSVSPDTRSATEEEPLVSVDPSEVVLSLPSDTSRSARQASTFSTSATSQAGDDIDDKLNRLVPLSSIFSAGRGKGGKKGGGLSSVVRAEDEDIDDDDAWRPSPEEYKKLSSKEKRQLRNKLSARAFRTRRKDYIGTLEAHIKDRDAVIDAIRSELITSRAENHDLRKELEALKASTMKILHPESANVIAPPPPQALLNALAMSSEFSQQQPVNGSSAPTLAPSLQLGPSSVAPSVKRTSSSSSIAINTRKDIGAFDMTRGFWGGGAGDSMFVPGGGSTICHTLFTPEVVFPPRANMNPLLNGDHHFSSSPASTSSSSSSSSTSSYPSSSASSTFTLGGVRNGTNIDYSTFSEWAEQTPFSLRTMDSYRIQMWSRLAREAAADKANLSGDMRPRFFVEPRSPTSSPTSSSSPSQTAALSTAVASATANHISSKLTSSFLSAFTTGPSAKLDTDKLTAVVTGKAHLAVIADSKNASSSSSSSSASSEKTVAAGSTMTTAGVDAADVLAYAMAGLKVQTGATTPAESLRVRENPLAAMAGFFKTALPARA